MSREEHDSSMDTSLEPLILERMQPYDKLETVTFTHKELDALLYDTLEIGYSQGAEDWYG